MATRRIFTADVGSSVLNSHGGDRLGEASHVSATDVKIEFGRVPERVIRGIIAITKHDQPKGGSAFGARVQRTRKRPSINARYTERGIR